MALYRKDFEKLKSEVMKIEDNVFTYNHTCKVNIDEDVVVTEWYDYSWNTGEKDIQLIHDFIYDLDFEDYRLLSIDDNGLEDLNEGGLANIWFIHSISKDESEYVDYYPNRIYIRLE
ncbi:hypothetical protein D3C74_381560 [compost metagenome]